MILSLNFLQKHSKIALGYFLVIAFLGVLLRFFSIVDFPINYRFIVHTHSHIALLGWIYTALTTLIFKMYLSKTDINSKYKRLFWVTQLTIVGMLITFPFTGYALFSIIFSTLFLIASYIFANLVFKYTPVNFKQTNSYKCIRVALWFMIVSSIGPWALGIIMKTAGSGSALYRNAIYFYLHFQYNGWFLLALLGIFFYILEKHEIILPKKIFQTFFWLINCGVILTFGISLLWMKPNIIVYLFSGLGALFQLVAFYLLLRSLKPFSQQRKTVFSHLSLHLLSIVAFLLLVKLIFQLMGSTPFFANAISTNVDLIIGYLHWTFLGVVSIPLMLFLQQLEFIYLSKRSIKIYLIGFILTEILLFYKGIITWSNLSLSDNYFIYLVIASCVLLIGIFNIFANQFKKQ